MSDLQERLDEATAERDRLLQDAERLVRRMTEVAIVELPIWAANATKHMATEQPAVTQSLGRDAAADLRQRIQATAEAHSDAVRDLIGLATWPHQNSDWQEHAREVDAHHITNVVSVPAEPMVDAVSELMREAGYEVIAPGYQQRSGREAWVGRRLGRFSVTDAKGMQPVCEEYSNVVKALTKVRKDVARANSKLQKALAQDIWGD